jgi:hypothetical protein
MGECVTKKNGAPARARAGAEDTLMLMRLPPAGLSSYLPAIFFEYRTATKAGAIQVASHSAMHCPPCQRLDRDLGVGRFACVFGQRMRESRYAAEHTGMHANAGRAAEACETVP